MQLTNSHETVVRRLRVLVAESNRAIADALASILLQSCDLAGIVNSEEALVRHTQSSMPDVIIADVMLTGLDGMKGIRQVRESYPSIPIILLALHSEAATVQSALRAGVRGYVLKEAAGEDLLAAVDEVQGGGVYISSGLFRHF